MEARKNTRPIHGDLSRAKGLSIKERNGRGNGPSLTPFGSLAVPEGPMALRLILADDLPLSRNYGAIELGLGEWSRMSSKEG
jgi:hypothetical protein